jgi:hypothetical protein
METWPQIRDSEAMRSSFPNRLTYHYWRLMFDRVYENKTDTWDIAWTYTIFKEHGLCIMPRTNLITNIGASVGATHKASAFSNIPTSPLIFPLNHPKEIKVDSARDIATYKKVFGIRNTFKNASYAFIKDKLPFVFKNVKLLVK